MAESLSEAVFRHAAEFGPQWIEALAALTGAEVYTTAEQVYEFASMVREFGLEGAFRMVAAENEARPAVMVTEPGHPRTAAAVPNIRLAIIRAEPGDVVVLETDEELTRSDTDTLRLQLTPIMPKGVRCMILANGMHLRKIARTPKPEGETTSWPSSPQTTVPACGEPFVTPPTCTTASAAAPRTIPTSCTRFGSCWLCPIVR